MNDIYARRASQTMMLMQTQRMLPTLWQATQITKEKLDARFVKEEFMRVNGHRQLHLLLGDVAMQQHQHTHWHKLHSTNAWAESHRAYSVTNHSPVTQRFADIGRLHDSIPNVRVATTAQAVVLEHIARTEGTFLHEVDVEAFRTLNDEDASRDEPQP
jgi:hypothetical protein